MGNVVVMVLVMGVSSSFRSGAAFVIVGSVAELVSLDDENCAIALIKRGNKAIEPFIVVFF